MLQSHNMDSAEDRAAVLPLIDSLRMTSRVRRGAESDIETLRADRLKVEDVVEVLFFFSCVVVVVVVVCVDGCVCVLHSCWIYKLQSLTVCFPPRSVADAKREAAAGDVGECARVGPARPHRGACGAPPRPGGCPRGRAHPPTPDLRVRAFTLLCACVD